MSTPDVEAALALEIAEGSTTFPTSLPPGGFSVVSRVGGEGLNIALSRPRVLIECYGRTRKAAFDRAAAAYAVVMAAKESGALGVLEVGDAEATEPVKFDDPRSPGFFRYQFVAQLTVSRI